MRPTVVTAGGRCRVHLLDQFLTRGLLRSGISFIEDLKLMIRFRSRKKKWVLESTSPCLNEGRILIRVIFQLESLNICIVCIRCFSIVLFDNKSLNIILFWARTVYKFVLLIMCTNSRNLWCNILVCSHCCSNAKRGPMHYYIRLQQYLHWKVNIVGYETERNSNSYFL